MKNPSTHSNRPKAKTKGSDCSITTKRKVKVHAYELDLNKVLASFGGSFPVCRGRKYKYPDPDDHDKWLKLIACAYTHRNRVRRALARGDTPPKRDFKLEYAMYHCRKEQILRRSKRNQHRRIIGEDTNLNGKDIHHTDPVNLTLKSARVLSEKEHQNFHRKEKQQAQQAQRQARSKK